MNFKQIVKNLKANVQFYFEQGELVKAQACADLAEMIETKGYTSIRGPVSFDSV